MFKPKIYQIYGEQLTENRVLNRIVIQKRKEVRRLGLAAQTFSLMDLI